MNEIPPDLLNRLCRVVERTFGLRAGPLEPGLDGALADRSRELNVTPADLMDRLTSGEKVDEGELACVVHKLMLGHTRFRRHERVWDWLEGNLDSLDLDPPINALVPGCSTGEEAYDLAMVLAEQFGLEHVFVTGLDLSHQALDRAARGVYPSAEAERLPADRVSRYFQPRGHGLVEVVEPLKRRVRFQWANIASGIPSGPYHVIFLRNLLTYLTDSAVEQVLQSVAGATVRDAILVLAPQETFMLGARPWAAPVEPGLPVYRCSTLAPECNDNRARAASRLTPLPQEQRAPLPTPQSPLPTPPAFAQGSGVVFDNPQSEIPTPQSNQLVLPGPALGRSSEKWLEFEARLKALLDSPPPTVTFDLSLLHKADYHVEKSLSAAVRLLRASGTEVLFVGGGNFLGPLFHPVSSR